MRDAALILFQFSWRHVYLVLKNILLIPVLIQKKFVKQADTTYQPEQNGKQYLLGRSQLQFINLGSRRILYNEIF